MGKEAETNTETRADLAVAHDDTVALAALPRRQSSARFAARTLNWEEGEDLLFCAIIPTGEKPYRWAGEFARARNGFEVEPWLAIKSEGCSRNPCGVRTCDKSAKRIRPPGRRPKKDPSRRRYGWGRQAEA